MWNSGITLRQMSLGARRNVEAMQRAPTHRFSCVSGTILGLLVVPLVCSTKHTSPRPPFIAAARGVGGTARPSGHLSVNQPASASEGTSSMTAMPISIARATVPSASGSRRRTMTACKTEAGGREG